MGLTQYVCPKQVNVGVPHDKIQLRLNQRRQRVKPRSNLTPVDRYPNGRRRVTGTGNGVCGEIVR